MKTTQLFENTGVWGSEKVEIKGLAWDSRLVEPGDLFIALVGKEADGHKYIDQAIQRGAAAILAMTEIEASVPVYLSKDTRRDLGLIAANFYAHPSEELSVIAVTATNGKTTTVGMLDSILQAAGLKVGVMGTVAVSYDDVVIPSLLTTPESVEIQKYLRQMKDAEVDVVTMEASSIGISSHRLAGVRLKVAAFNNISAEHLDLHGSFEAYLKAKASLIEGLAPDATAILNFDEPLIRDLKTQAEVIYFSVRSEVDIHAEKIDLSTGRAVFDLVLERDFPKAAKGVYPMSLSIAGYHSLSNALSAAAIALSQGCTIEQIKAGLKAFRGIERRFEIIYEGDFTIVDDHFANVGNIDVTLKTLSLMDRNRITLVYGIRGSRGVQTNRENTEAIVKWNDSLKFQRIIASLSEDYTMKKDKVLPEELEVFQKTMLESHLSYELFQNLEDAVEEGLKSLKNGDVLLLAGCQGMDFGGSLALCSIAKTRPEAEREKVLKPLKFRVAGHLEDPLG